MKTSHQTGKKFITLFTIFLLLFTAGKTNAQDQTYCFVAGSSANFTGYNFTLNNTCTVPTDNNCPTNISGNNCTPHLVSQTYSLKFSQEIKHAAHVGNPGGLYFTFIIKDEQQNTCFQQTVTSASNLSGTLGCTNSGSSYNVSISQVNFDCGDFGDYDFDLEITNNYAATYQYDTGTQTQDGDEIYQTRTDNFSETCTTSNITLSLFCPQISPLSQNVCVGQTAQISADGYPDSAPGFSWTNNFNGTNPSTLTKNFGFTPTAPGTYVYSLYFNNAVSCPSNVLMDGNAPAGTATIHVSALPVLNISPNVVQDICYGQQASFQLSGSTSYSIASNGATINANNGSSFNPSPTAIGNTVYNITGINNGYCTGKTTPKTVTVNVAQVGDFNLTSSVPAAPYDFICPGSNVTLTATNINSVGSNNNYVWSTGVSGVNSIVVTPNATTTYYCTVTGSNGCEFVKTITVKVVPNFIPAAISVPYAFQCEGANSIVNISTPTIAYQAYSWSANNGATVVSHGSSVSVNCANATGDVTLNLTATSQGCPTYTSVVIKQCCKAPLLNPLGHVTSNLGAPSDPINPTYTYLQNANLTNNATTTTYYVTGNLYFEGNSTINGVNLVMNPGSSITVDAGATLNITNSHIYACSDMWQGINFNTFFSHISPYGLAVPTLKVTNSLIEDAITGVNIAYSSFVYNSSEASNTATKPVVNLNNAWFNRCTIGVLADYDPMHPDSTTNAANHFSTNQNFNGGVITASNSVFACLNGITMSMVNPPNYNTAGLTAALLHNYLYKPNFYSFCGIVANSSSFVNGTINSCYFDNVMDGIVSYNNPTYNTDPYTSLASNLNVTSCSFQRAHLDAASENFNLMNNFAYGVNNYPGTSAGVYIGGTYYYPYLSSASNGFGYKSGGGTAGAGINFFGSQLSVGGSTATSCTFTNSDYGIYALPDGNLPVTINYNAFKGTTHSGIYMSDAAIYSGLLQPISIANNTFQDHFQQGVTLKYLGYQDNGNINVSSNNFTISAGHNAYWQSFFQNPATYNYAPEAIWVTSFGLSAPPFGNGTSYAVFGIGNNAIHGYEKGIRGSSAYYANIQSNIIDGIPDDANSNYAYGISLTNCDYSTVTFNTVGAGTGNGAGWNYNQFGIFTENSAHSQILCNTVNGPDVSLKCQGSNNVCNIEGNTFSNAAIMNFWLDVNGLVGPQGLPNYGCADKFGLDNPWGSVLFASGGSNGALSPFYYLNGAPQIPASSTFSGSLPTAAIPLGGVYALPVKDFAFKCNFGKAGPSPITNALVAQKIASNSIEFASNNATAVYGNQRDLYSALVDAGSAFYSADPLLSTYMTSMAGSSHEKLLKTDALFASGDISKIDEAIRVNNSFAPANKYDNYLQKINNLYVAYIKAKKRLNTTQVQDVRNIATLCPFEYGEGVYKARALLSLYDTINYVNPCEIFTAPNIFNGANNQTAAIENAVVSKSTIKVYPNPANNTIHMQGLQLHENDKAEIAIYNIMGQVVLKTEYNKTMQATDLNDIDISLLSNGSYIYKVVLNGALVQMDKLIILK